ncbi:hypothetical protein, partial [Acinetobacter baumannii]
VVYVALQVLLCLGFTVTQLVVHFPLVLFLLWFFGRTLSYTPPTF